MLRMVDIEYIRKKHFVEGWSIRKISRQLDLARQTVRKALQSSEIPRYNLSQAKISPVLEPYKDLIRQWLKDDETQPVKQRHTARHIFNRLCDEYDFTGGESTVRRFVQQEKNNVKEVFIPLAAEWGEQAQVDWGRAKIYLAGKLTEVSLFCLRMKASLVPFVWASPTEKLEAFLEGHKRSFEWLGGVPWNLVYDNPKTAVTKILKGPYRQEHNHFSSMRAHYLFDSEFCNPNSGNEKGTVENLVKYVRQNAMVPLPNVASLDELNSLLLSWCEKQRQRRFKEWEEEQKSLRPLPSITFKCSKTELATANKMLLFQFDRNHYSVPVECAYKKLRIEAFVDRIEVYDKAVLVTTHERFYSRGEKIMKLEHYLPVLKEKPRAAKNALVVRKLPEVYQKLRIFLCQRNLDGYREFAKILLLNMDFNFEDVLRAIEESFVSGYIGYEYIRQRLLTKKHTQEPQLLGITPSNLPELAIPVESPAKFNWLMDGITA